jgi:hypothetical protein
VQETTDLLGSLQGTWTQFVALLPRLGIALLLLMVGWVVATLARKGAIRIARLLRIDVLAERAGIEGFLVQGGVRYTAVTLIGGAFYWGVLFLSFVALLNVIGSQAAQDLLERIVAFVPNVVVIVVVLIFGSAVARFVGSVTYTYLNNVGSRAAGVIATLARFAMLFFVVSIALEQLQLRSDVLVAGFQIAFGAICFGLALAFGLGGRRWAERILDRVWKN